MAKKRLCLLVRFVVVNGYGKVLDHVCGGSLLH